MSKISDLRRQAQQELRARRYDKAVALYEQICSKESSNAGYRNELGDIHLKMGELPRAIECFREAAALYRAVGLTNNAVAILKKVLRQDPHHFDSLWELAEIRSDQGLETEAVRSFLDYLRTADVVPEEGREAFLRRSSEVLDRWGDEPEVLAELDGLFERWEAEQERAQVLVAKAALARQEGEADIAGKYIEHARTVFEHLDSLPAYVAYCEAGPPADLPDDLEFEQPVSSGVTPVQSSEPDAESEGDDEEPSLEYDLSDESGAFEIPEDPGEDPAPDDVEDGDATETAATAEESGPVETVAVANDPEPGYALEDLPEDATPAAQDEPVDSPADSQEDPSVDLLDAILSDGDLDLGAAEKSQLDTIASEMEGQMADHVDPGDHAGQYDLGMVYADMGLIDQAVTAFERAAEAEEFRLRALEMAAGCRLDAGQVEEAIELFQRGLEVTGHGEQAYLGLLYGLGSAYESRSDHEAAIECFEKVAVVDPAFRGVSDHLRELHSLDSPS